MFSRGSSKTKRYNPAIQVSGEEMDVEDEIVYAPAV